VSLSVLELLLAPAANPVVQGRACPQNTATERSTFSRDPPPSRVSHASLGEATFFVSNSEIWSEGGS
jgi:hypothetical protein